MKLISKRFLWPLLIAGLTAIIFLPVLRGEFLNWDDKNLFVNNPYYRGMGMQQWRWMCTSFFFGHWQPLSWLSCALDYKVWGMNPLGWHATNLLLHAVNAVLVYLLCLAFIKKSERRYGVAVLAALFWAIHPLRVEAVAWLATRGYLLCTTFCLLTILSYLKAIDRQRYPLAALFFFSLATFTKGIGMMLPLVLLLMDWVPLQRVRSTRSAFHCVLEKIPFFILSLVTGITAFLAKKVDGGMAPVEDYGFAERFGQAVYGVWFYLFKMVSPVNLLPLYDKRPEAGPVMIALVLTATAAIFIFLFRHKLRLVTVILGAFLLLIFPMIGFTQSGVQLFADRFTYLATVPFAILLSAGLMRLKIMRRTVCGALTVLFLFFGIQTFVFSGIWSSSLSLWSYAVARDEKNAKAWNNVGLKLMEHRRFEKAVACFDRALSAQADCSDALMNRAIARNENGDYALALTDINKALSLDGLSVVNRVKMLIGRGRIYENLNNPEQALADYSTLIGDSSVELLWKLLALQLRARLYLQTERPSECQSDLISILKLPDPTGEYWQRAIFILERLKKIPRE